MAIATAFSRHLAQIFNCKKIIANKLASRIDYSILHTSQYLLGISPKKLEHPWKAKTIFRQNVLKNKAKI